MVTFWGGVGNCLEDSTISTLVHTSETRMCGDKSTSYFFLSGRQYIGESQSGTAFQADKDIGVSIRGHPLLRRVCTSVTHSVAFQAI